MSSEPTTPEEEEANERGRSMDPDVKSLSALIRLMEAIPFERRAWFSDYLSTRYGAK